MEDPQFLKYIVDAGIAVFAIASFVIIVWGFNKSGGKLLEILQNTVANTSRLATMVEKSQADQRELVALYGKMADIMRELQGAATRNGDKAEKILETLGITNQALANVISMGKQSEVDTLAAIKELRSAQRRFVDERVHEFMKQLSTELGEKIDALGQKLEDRIRDLLIEYESKYGTMVVTQDDGGKTNEAPT